MDQLFSYQNKLLEQTPGEWYRSMFRQLEWEQRLLGIKGLRGVGKTTLLLQYLKHHYPEPESALYVTADDPWFYNRSLAELIEEWHKYGGKLLLVDEVHKYPNWSRELKVGYDGHPDMRFIFTASSAFDVFKGEADLSRRAIVRDIPGMSFREYLHFAHGLEFDTVSLNQLLKEGPKLTKMIKKELKPLPLFNEYLQQGYFPFSGKEEDWRLSREKFISIVNVTLETDLAFVEDYSASNILKIKKLLGVIADSAPFEPNISKIAKKLKIGRNTVYNFLKHLEDTGILRLQYKRGSGITALQKPEKVYFENPNIAMAYGNASDKGALRETFFINQLHNAGYKVNLAEKGDFIVEDQYVFEVGGKNKQAGQVKEVPESRLALDEIEYAFGNKIPLWMFGFLY